MPRPARTRRVRVAAAAAAAAPVEPPAPENNKSSPAPASGSDIYGHSDREHSVIRKEHEEKEASKRLSRNSSLRQRQALEKAGRARDDALDRLAAEVDATSSKGKTSDDKQASESANGTGRKTQATPVKQRRDTSGLDLDDELFEGLDSTLAASDDDEAAAPPSAPRSDTSTFSVSHFRRRGRAPSISINKDDAPIRPSSRGVTTPGISSAFNIGLFRRRRREPSILGTAQKERAPRPVEPSSEPASEDEDVEDFNPEAESTPLNNRRRTQPAAADPDSENEPTDSQQILAPDSQPDAASSVKSRKRKSTETHENQNHPSKASRVDSDAEDAPGLDGDDSDSSLSDLPSPTIQTPTRESNLPRPVTPNQDDIMAPPESSGSEDGDEAWPDIRTLAKQRRRRQSPTTPNRDGNISNASSPPSLTHSPNFPVTRNKTKAKKQRKKVTTADLTGLLPQKIYKKTRGGSDSEESDEDVDTSSLGEDDDELSYIGAHARSRRALNRGSANRPASRGKATGSATKAKATPTPRGGRVSRTYGRRLSDKENDAEVDVEAEDEDGPDAGAEGEDSFAPADDTLVGEESSDPVRNADELKQAVRKFKEVDRWELEFEEVTEGSSPNRDAR
ncbi:hypothetical protein CTRI78_v004796 [Colletotrichum trifolii]|uniref:Uncharacterized protein n=1 Tax=Colletotrichum trifolii TaxID=5466 RepID=A0A4R8RGA5_COLTR|nr:hypothetical protein CTRI78_v004796 [Colletotrichum trifolii]